MNKKQILSKIKNKLEVIYLYNNTDQIFLKLNNIINKYYNKPIIKSKRKKYGNKLFLSEKDSILITYGDSIKTSKEKPLKTLYRFLRKYIKNTITGVHILPFFPSSDDAFSIVDYRNVSPELGNWKDIQKIAKDYHLMADLVLNHVSKESKWFKGFLKGDKKYMNYFIAFNKKIDTNLVFRPRTNPLLTGFKTKKGLKYVWTTFSDNQVDLNFKNPDVLLEIIDLLLFYLSNGVEIIRLDAIGFLWKELGTSCFNLKNSHEIVKLLRLILSYVAPYAILITETNAPYKYNISYFGRGDESHMVYQVTLPLLVLDAFIREDTSHLQEFYKRIEPLKAGNLFFNFLASHDGINMISAKGLLTKKQSSNLINEVKKHNGLISYRSVPDGTKAPYELNINYFDAINNPNRKTPIAKEVKRFISSQSLIIANNGVPGVYIHSLIGSRNYLAGVKKTGIKRMINREKINFTRLEKQLRDKKSIRHNVLKNYLRLLDIRTKIPELNPFYKQKVIYSDKRLFIVSRLRKNKKLVVIINVSNDIISLSRYKGRTDLLSKRRFNGKVQPNGVYFLK
ncbi:MAG: sugar phosphorylase [Nanoarchaeota archaeon]|nr:sugar phosphorylase [Nanoarchaeota archaeon]